MTEITPDSLAEQLSAGEDLYVLDIRYAEDFAEWHILGSSNIDVYDQLAEDPSQAKSELEAIPEESEVVTVCAAGKLSALATEVLLELGYEAKTLVDGMTGWSRVHRYAAIDIGDTGMLIQIAWPGKGCLSHIFQSEGVAVIFDPSHYSAVYEEILKEFGATAIGVLDTHAHADHVSGGRVLADHLEVPYYLHPADAENIDVSQIVDGDTITVGSVDISVMHTPGHSQGSVTFAISDSALLTGDTLFHQSVGRVELGVEAGIENTDVETNAETLYNSIRRIRNFNGEALILPAHDPGSPEPPVVATLNEVEDRNTDLHLPKDEFIDALSTDIPDHPPNFQTVKRVNIGEVPPEKVDIESIELGPNRCAAE